LEKTIASERTKLTADLKHAKETMTLEKNNATKDLAAMKDKAASATGGYTGLKNRAIAAEADKVALKGEIACIGEEVGRLDKAATRLLREKHEMWQSISELQSTITSELSRASRLANEGFDVSSEEGALLKLYYKMQHYVNYKLAKRS
jgi:chromosome segregation ATPase